MSLIESPIQPDLRHTLFKVGDWLVDPRANRIEREDEVRSLRNKAMELLVLLAQNAGSVVLRDEIVEKVWDGNDYVAAKGITNTIWTLRQTLGDTADEPVYIETIAKRGYRLLCPVLLIPVPASFPVAPEAGPGDADDQPRSAATAAAGSDATPADQVNSGPTEAGISDSGSAASDFDNAPTGRAETGRNENGHTETRHAETGFRPDTAVSLAPLPASAPVHAAPATAPALAARRRAPLLWGGALAGVAVLAAFGWMGREEQLGVDFEQLAARAEITPLVTTPEREALLTLAPGGQQMAYVSTMFRTSPSVLSIRGLGESDTPVQIRTYAEQPLALAFAPDGKQLAVARREAEQGCVIELIAIDSLQIRPLAACSKRGKASMAFAPDGRSLAVEIDDEQGQGGIGLIDVASGQARMLVAPQEKTELHVGGFSPDGRELLFLRAHELFENELVRVDMDGRETRIWKGRDQYFAPGAHWWHANHVLLASGFEGQDLMINDLDLRSGRFRSLGLTGAAPYMLDEGRVLFIRNRNQHALSRISLREDGARIEPLVRMNGILTHPRYNADGSFLFMSNATGHMEIYEGQPDGSHRQLTRLHTRAWDPGLSPDGRWLSFAGHCAEGMQVAICLQELKTGGVSVLFTSSQPAEAPQWLADGRHLVFALHQDGKQRIGRIDVVERKVDWLTELPKGRFRISGDGRQLYWSDPVQPGVQIRDLAGGTGTILAPDLPPSSTLWELHDGGVRYVVRQPDRSLAIRADDGKGQVRTLGRLNNVLIDAAGGLATSADGAALLIPEMTAYTYDPAIARVRP